MTDDCKLCKYSAICVVKGPENMFWGFVNRQVDEHMVGIARKTTMDYDRLCILENMSVANVSYAWAARMRRFLPMSCPLRRIVGHDFQDG